MWVPVETKTVGGYSLSVGLQFVPASKYDFSFSVHWDEYHRVTQDFTDADKVAHKKDDWILIKSGTRPWKEAGRKIGIEFLDKKLADLQTAHAKDPSICTRNELEACQKVLWSLRDRFKPNPDAPRVIYVERDNRGIPNMD